MKAVIAIDSFKGSLSSRVAGEAVRAALTDLDSRNEAVVLPMADGGEGTLEALSDALDGEIVEISVTGPRGKSVTAKYALLGDGGAVVEMAQAAGLPLLTPDERDPLETTTYGVGEIILDAVSRGARSFIVGIGGSATNDGGVGMLSALGFDFLDAEKNPIPRGAKGLERLSSISRDNVIPALAECTFRVACDVTNPLCGERGCSAVFAPQKGGTPEAIAKMDKWLSSYADLAEEKLGVRAKDHPGSGAAGGLGFAFLAFTDATLESGIDIVLDRIGLEEHVKDADLVITGEGRLDSQSVMGKAPVGVAKLAKKHGKPVIAFCGAAIDGAEACNGAGIDAFFPIVRGATTLEEAMDETNAYRNLYATATQVIRLIKTFR